MKRETSHQLTPEQQRELDALAAMPDEEIDTSDAPELADWSIGVRGKYYRPIKQQVTMRLDADILAYFQQIRGRGFTTEINRVLREYVEQHPTHK